jgi:crotonobetainyl-CoA:carnitine CoA-transferase CaiB-like acyl-CoA transferase
MTNVLEDIRVLDLTQAMAGPICAMLLGDFGADVIKIERPGSGDQARGWGPPFVQSESTYFLSANRNKRSLTLNIDKPEALEVLHDLVRRSDVFIINQPTLSSLQKRKIDYDSLRALNPRLIYVSITGYGFTGPKAGLAGYDLVAQAEAGLMSFTGMGDWEPMKYPIPIADITTGIYSALGVLVALRARDQTGMGQFLDMALFDSQLTWLNHVGSDYLNAGVEPKKIGNTHASIVPYQVFRAQDKYLIIGVGSEALWRRFLNVLNAEDSLGRDERFTTNRLRNENRKELIEKISAILAARPAAEWIDLLKQAEIPTAPIHSTAEALSDAQTRARGMIVEIEHPLIGVAKSVGNPIHLGETPVTYRRYPPMLGEHTNEILHELGKDDVELTRLREAKAI